MYNAVDIARYIVNRCSADNRPVTNLKLQKLLYFVWIDYYNSTGKYLFENDICAWPLGPVVPDAYDEFCVYGGLPIRKNYNTHMIKEDALIIDKTLDKLIFYTASQLVDRTHAPGTPWEKTYNKGLGKRRIIPFELIIQSECS